MIRREVWSFTTPVHMRLAEEGPRFDLNFGQRIRQSGIKDSVQRKIFSHEILSKLPLEKAPSQPAPAELDISEEEMLARGWDLLPHAPRLHYRSIVRGGYIFTLHQILSGVLQFQTARIERPDIIDLVTVTNDLLEIQTRQIDFDNPQNSRVLRHRANDESVIDDIERKVQELISPNPVQLEFAGNIFSV
ncbi:MAG: hypothetical protein HY344_00700 [Candidatus Levybacteria bacterium]|nr:hypothetical protein [Candidatus Levybacteria bacterium]